MGILDRMNRLIRANVNDLIDRAEDPEKMIDQILRDMESNIVTARSQVAAMIAQEKELEADLRETRELSTEWGEKAKRAVGAGKDDLAREALRRKRDNEENSKVYEQQFQTQQQSVEKLKQQLQLLESKYQTTMSQRDSLIARQRRAKATKQVAEFTSNLSPLDAGAELDRMERKIRSTEAQAAALADMESTSFDAQFRELDYDVDIEKELEALKGGSGATAGQIEAGSTDSNA
ncbi:MAG TPA: PspA/IM30 family protein [Thermomicrobiales bacterium]|nr:PspA/IM30 family protein [Thermomicrobiales bacterium]